MTDWNDENPFRDDPSTGGANPFRTPADIGPAAGTDAIVYHGASYVRQIRPVAICMMVHGGLIGLLSVMMIIGAIAMANMPMQQVDDPAVEAMMPMIFSGYAIAGGVLLLVAILQVVAGIRNYLVRNRVLGIVALCVGVLPALTCYCAPTAIGLAIWGLIVYLNPGPTRAFELVGEGENANVILDMARKTY